MTGTGPLPKLERARGVLLDRKAVESGRLSPSVDLSDFIEHYWWVRWNVLAPHTSEVLSHPSLHIVFEAAQARAFGVVRGKFSRTLEGQGRVFGIKLRPAMAGHWLTLPVSRWTDTSAPLRQVLRSAAESDAEVAAAIGGEADALRCAEIAEAWLRKLPNDVDPYAPRLRDVVEQVRSDPDLVSVEQLARVARLPVRQLQRLFQRYVGVTPKWVVQRYRLHEAAEQLERSDASIASIAARLGYFDQAHFVRDFKRVVGWPPSEHVRRATQRDG